MKFTENEHKNSTKPIYFLTIIISLFVCLFIKIFILDFVKISGNSMETTFHDGQIVAVSKILYGIVKPFTSEFIVQWKTPRVNDIVIFLHGDKMLIKRCIATEKVPLEYIEDYEYYLKVENNQIPINETQFTFLKQYDKVSDNCIFVLGDNFRESIDSRDFGFISTKNVIGKVLCK